MTYEAINQLSRYASQIMSAERLDRTAAWRVACRRYPDLAKQAGLVTPVPDKKNPGRGREKDPPESAIDEDLMDDMDEPDEEDEEEDENEKDAKRRKDTVKNKAEQQLAQLARDYQQKSGASFAQSYAAVLESHPQLYAEYLRERDSAALRQQLRESGLRVA